MFCVALLNRVSAVRICPGALVFVLFRGGFGDWGVGAAGAGLRLVVSLWSAGCVITWTVCLGRERTPADVAGMAGSNCRGVERQGRSSGASDRVAL